MSAPQGPVTVQDPDDGIGIDLGADRRDTDHSDTILLDGTLVLVGCGKAKRDPEDPTDLHVASVGPDEPMSPIPGAETGPAWPAGQLYTSTYFASKRGLAEAVTGWARGYDAGDWAVLSAEHGVVSHQRDLKVYDTTIDDLGDDPTDQDHRVPNRFARRRPDGQEIVTEMDLWATNVAYSLCRWVAGFRERGADPWENDADTLLVLAGQDYIEPLRERGVFEYGIARMAGDPNEGATFPLRTRFLFDEIDAGGIGEQMAWLSDAIDRLDQQGVTPSDQHGLGDWTGDNATCDGCGGAPPEVQLGGYGEETYCESCAPDRCARCDAWTHSNGLGGYPLCEDCQTDRGGQTNAPLHEEDTEQEVLAGEQ